MSLKLTKVFRTKEDKEGNPLIFKSGKNQGQPYEKLLVKAEEHGERWISGFSDDWNLSWQEGDTVDAEVVESGDYLNLRRPSLTDKLKEIDERLAAVEQFISSGGDVEHDDDATPKNIPF